MTKQSPGAMLRRYRRAANMTQRQVADQLDITASAVSQWEVDATKPERHHAVMLDELLAADGRLAAEWGWSTVSRRVGNGSAGDVAALAVTIDDLAERLDAALRRIAQLERHHDDDA